MNTSVSTDVKSLTEVVRDKVKESFVNLIPDDQWNELVKKCTDEFVNKELENTIKQELKKKLSEKIAEELEKETYVGRFDPYGRPLPSVMVEMITKNLATDLVQAMFSGIVAEAVRAVSSAMRNTNNGNRY